MGTLDLRRSHPTPLTRAPNRHHHRDHTSHTTQVRDSEAAKPLEMRVAIRQIVAVSIGSEALEESGALKRSRSAGESGSYPQPFEHLRKLDSHPSYRHHYVDNPRVDECLFMVHSNQTLEIEVQDDNISAKVQPLQQQTTSTPTPLPRNTPSLPSPLPPNCRN